MTPSMKSGIYHVYILLEREGHLATIKKATCECAAGESASCTHVSGLLHALAAITPANVTSTSTPDETIGSDDNDDEPESLPVTSFACKWKPPRKRKECVLKFADANFEKHVYGRQKKYTWDPIKDFDPRPVEYRGSAPQQMETFLKAVKGKGLGVSMLLDDDAKVKKSDSVMVSSGLPTPPCRDEIIQKVTAFKESLAVTADKVREVERNTRDQHQSPFWYSVRRFRLTASMFGRIFQRLPTTPPDSLVKELLHSKQISTSATEWGKSKESTALQEYIAYNNMLGRTEMVVCKSGFVICQQYPFLGASPDAYGMTLTLRKNMAWLKSNAHLNIQSILSVCVVVFSSVQFILI